MVESLLMTIPKYMGIIFAPARVSHSMYLRYSTKE